MLAMAEQLAAGDFQPLDFELDISDRGGELPPLDLGDILVEGKVDRVDGWSDGEKPAFPSRLRKASCGYPCKSEVAKIIFCPFFCLSPVFPLFNGFPDRLLHFLLLLMQLYTRLQALPRSRHSLTTTMTNLK